MLSFGSITKNTYYPTSLGCHLYYIRSLSCTSSNLQTYRINFGYDTGIKTNVDKTEYISTSKYKHKSMQLENKNTNYEEYHKVLEFKYFSSLIA